MGSSQWPGPDGLLTLQREMRPEGKEVSIARLCRWFGVARSSFYYRPEQSSSLPVIDGEVCGQIRAVIEDNPTHGVRLITAVVRRKAKSAVNRKKVHRIIKLNGWQVRRKSQGKRPRAPGWTSRASKANERWAVDATHVFCGRDGWCHLTAIIDCWDRMIVGWRLSKTGSRRSQRLRSRTRCARERSIRPRTS